MSVLATSALTIAVSVVVWAVSGAGSFWPMWVIFGLGVVLVGSGRRAFGSRPSNSRNDDDAV